MIENDLHNLDQTNITTIENTVYSFGENNIVAFHFHEPLTVDPLTDDIDRMETSNS